MFVEIKTVSGRIICMEMYEYDTIYYIKYKLQMKEGYHPNNQRLLFQNNVLEDDKTLKDYKIKEGSMLTLFIRA